MSGRAGVMVAMVACLVTIACGPGGGAAGEPTAGEPTVEQVPGSVVTETGDLRRLARQFERLARSDERVQSVGRTGDAVSVELRADAESLAAELHDRYGDAVELLVGGIPFPPSDIPSDLRCPSPAAQPWPIGVTATLELDDHTVPQGGSTNGVATVRNASDERFVLEIEEPALGWVYDVGDVSSPRGHPGVVYETTDAGGSEPSGPRRVLAPGESTRVWVPVGTVSCEPTRGYALPPGDYDVRAQLGVAGGPMYLTEPAPLRVTPR